MIAWNTIDTVLLDMDGTLLDLHYDNHFWLEHVPRRFAEKNGLSYDAARAEVLGRYKRAEGTLDWYCVDYWSRELDLDISQLKEEVDHLIAVHPHVLEFLHAVRASGRRMLLVTNAHGKTIEIKFRRTRLGNHFDAVVCSHDLELPKEHTGFWRKLNAAHPFDRHRALLVDDSLPVLRAARDYGIGQLLAVYQPDSKLPEKDVGEFPAIRSFSEIMPGNSGGAS
jgi:putative hydrolase of the HAD superfamily